MYYKCCPHVKHTEWLSCIRIVSETLLVVQYWHNLSISPPWQLLRCVDLQAPEFPSRELSAPLKKMQKETPPVAKLPGLRHFGLSLMAWDAPLTQGGTEEGPIQL